MTLYRRLVPVRHCIRPLAHFAKGPGRPLRQHDLIAERLDVVSPTSGLAVLMGFVFQVGDILREGVGKLNPGALGGRRGAL